MLFTATAVASFCHARARQHFISHSLASLPHLAPISPPHHEHSGGASGRDNHSRMGGGALKREGGVRHRYCTITKREREREGKWNWLSSPPFLLPSAGGRRMEVQPWWQREWAEGGAARAACYCRSLSSASKPPPVCLGPSSGPPAPTA